jgi:hypothetical protein
MPRLAAFRIGLLLTIESLTLLLKNELDEKKPFTRFSYSVIRRQIILLATLYFCQAFTGGYHQLRYILVSFMK